MEKIILNEQTMVEHTTLIIPQEAEDSYNLTKYISYPFMDFIDGSENEYEDETQEIRLHRGNLHVASVSSSESRDWNPYCLIVDGNLTVDGDFCWGESGNGCFVYITGNLTARNVLLEGNPEIVVLGNLNAENCIVGAYGDDGGVLHVQKDTTAKLVLAYFYFNMYIGDRPNAITIGDEVDMPEADYEFRSTAKEILLPEFWDEEEGYVNGSAVRKAAREGRQILINENLKVSGIRPAAKPKEDDRLFHAVCNNDIEAVKNLIAEGVDLNQMNHKCLNRSPLIQACLSCHEDIALLLIDAGADILLKGHDKYPIQLAAEFGAIAITKRLLAMGSPVNIQHDGTSTIERVAMHGHLEIVKLLIDAGADPILNRRDRALAYAKKNRNEDMANLLAAWK
ncbi:ankyrin repeat domain-containing protein [Parabacteroides sp. PF5-9]|uniref:ankyrin repeat domain-containing protein n=1 Tax=Parabacteroides sp. PF5-9 TaxID=1742404 RepID=UPI00247371D1|nr:ankyrin repeat domain-containing protein [Parabacteroides sp. PF5-9]MDH6357295.1 ankyrin repeat protein [Parabacteroides sp. PF5-9]